jgi:hypothetical protein
MVDYPARVTDPASAPQPYQPTPPPAGGTRNRLIGIAVGITSYALAWVITLNEAGWDDYNDQYTLGGYALVAVGLTVLLFLLVVGLAIPKRTRDFALGLAIGTMIGVFCGGGVCVGLLSGTIG